MRFLITLLVALSVGVAAAQQHDVKGQSQLAGGTGAFGVTYSLKNGFNFAILGAHYTLDAYNAYTPLTGETDKKILVIDIAVKNAKDADNFFNSEGLVTLVDDHDQVLQGGSLMLDSQPSDSASFTLRPGQGLGQPALKDSLHIAFNVPAKSKVVKIMINQGRLNTNEEVFRYLLVAPPKPGTTPTNKTFIAPLPDNARDPSDPLGATVLTPGNGSIGTYVPSGAFMLRLDGVASPADAKVDGNGPEDGKKFVVATFTAKSMLVADHSMFDVTGGDFPVYEVVDADGEHYKPLNFRKAKADESPERTFKLGDEYSFRVVFQLPKDSKAKKLVYGTGGSSTWAVSIEG